MRFSSSYAAVLATVPLALAQTSTDCNPTEKSCPADTGLNAATYSANFLQGSSANASWSAAAYTSIQYGDQGAEFTINEAGQAPTIQTDFYFFFGRVDVKMKAAPGVGIVSSIVLESDDLDEIDWEFLGANNAQGETNFFGKGNTTTYNRAIYYDVATPQDTFHTYSVDWTAEKTDFIIDGTTVRTLYYTDAIALGGKNYPQTPMRLKLGNWPVTPSATGTVEWAGGNVTWSDAPFTMYVESVSIVNYNPADSYEYGDLTGDWQSIKLINGSSTSSASGGPTAASEAAPTSVASTATVAPTASLSVGAVTAQSAAAVSTTQTGAAYSTNSASVSAQNANGTAASVAASAPTEVPGASPNATSVLGSTTPRPTTVNGASTLRNGMVAGSLLSVALGFLLL